MNIFDIIKLIVGDYKKELLPDEELTLQDWGEEKPQNQQLLDHFNNKSEVDKNLVIIKNLNETEGWKNVKSKYNKRKRFYIQSWLKYVAVFVGIIFLGAIIILTMHPNKVNHSLVEQNIPPSNYKAIFNIANQQVFITDSIDKVIENENGIIAKINQGKIEYLIGKAVKPIEVEITVPNCSEYKFQLSDGTSLWMNAGSRVKFNHPFEDSNRIVFIEGEVFFDVARDETRPFIVGLPNKDSIKVLGTKFNVRAYPDDMCTSAVLAEGKISWSLEDNKEWIINTGQLLTKDNKNKTVNIQDVEVTPYLAWIDGQFYYKNHQLKDVLEDISRWYDTEFVIEDQYLQSLRISLKLERYSNLKDILEILELTGKVKFITNGLKINVVGNETN